MNRPRRGLILALAAGGLLVLVGAGLLRSALESSAADASLASAGPVVDAGAIAKLDPESRELALVLQPDESVDAVLIAADRERAEDIAAAARIVGLDPVMSFGEEAMVSLAGRSDVILSLLPNPAVGRAELREDRRALRPVAPRLPAGWSMPVPGRPYVGEILPVDPSAVVMPAQRRAFLLAAIADFLVTIDGAPYAALRAEGSCGDEPATDCLMYVFGSTAGASGVDTWPVRAAAATGWLAGMDPANGPYLGGVPRWLAREAERIARADPAAGQDLADYESIFGITWDPARPGIISITYDRGCLTDSGRKVASIAAGPLADTGECIDILTVVVDVGTSQVVDVKENLAGH